ncbi:MAG: ATP-binding cassette domain-containing protein [Thermodesulfobacteriota bacterium]
MSGAARRLTSAHTIITVAGLTKRFGHTTALDNIDLGIEQGELFGLLGPNGAGKTTLISILSTIVRPTEGHAMVCGHDVGRDQDAVRKCIGVVFQDPSLDDELTGEENLDFHGRLYGIDAKTRARRIDEVLDLVELSDRRHDLVKTYSGGMRRRLEIARGLLHRPEVLFLDEPTLGLDPQTRRRIWNHILDLKESYGTTIILTTHYMDEADQLCSRIAIIDHGRIIALDTPEAMKADLGGDLLELGIANPDPQFLETIRKIPEVAQVSVQEDKLMVAVENGESFIPRVLSYAHEVGVPIGWVSMRKPNLEDVFINLTGREIRDEAITEPGDRIRIFLRRRSK